MSEKEFVVPEELVIASRADLSGNIIAFNQGFQMVSGYSADELLGKPHSLLRHPDMPQAVFADLWRTLKAGLPWFAVLKNRRKDGDFYWVTANAVPIMAHGKITGYLSLRYPASREQIAQAEQLYAGICAGKQQFPKTKPATLSSAVLSLVVGTMIAIGIVLYMLLSEAENVEVVGSLLVIFVGLMGYGMQRLLKLMMPTAELRAGVEAMSNGQLRQPIRGNTPMTVWLNTVRSRLADLDAQEYDLRQQAEAMKQAETQRQLHQDRLLTIGSMAAGMAHEINNPIAGIMMNVEYLQSSQVGQEETQVVLDESLRELKRVSRLIKSMLGFSRKSDKKIDQMCRLRSILDETLVIVEPLLKTASVALHYDQHNSELEQCLSVDPEALKQVLVNLISNAVHAMSDTPPTERLLSIDCQAINEKQQLIIRVSDTGSGIPDELKTKIFDPFFTTKPQGEGTGLGLSICFKIVHDFGGLLLLDDSYTQGARFLLYVPAQDRASVFTCDTIAHHDATVVYASVLAAPLEK